MKNSLAISRNGGHMKKSLFCLFLTLLFPFMFISCSSSSSNEVDDYVSNDVSISDNEQKEENKNNGIDKSKIKIGVIHIGDPKEGSGYTYTHDLGIQGMQQNLGLEDNQIIRKNNVSDSDKDATDQAIKECIDSGCNIILELVLDIWKQ